MSAGMLVFTLTIGLLASAWALPTHNENEAADYRLPQHIYPEYYRLEIITNLADENDNFTFEGRVWIQVKCLEATSKIVLHSKNLNINEKAVRVWTHSENSADFESILGDDKDEETDCDQKCQDERPLKILEHAYHDDYELYIIQLEEKLKPESSYSILIPYFGELTQGLAGYYRSSYKDIDSSEIKWLAVTQFESTDARRAFPCFDEPAFKAKFQVNLGHINTRSSISNMRIMAKEPINGMKNWVWDRYEVTVPMSTYLLAFIVSEFDYKVSPKSKTNDVLFRVWARKDAIDQVDYATVVGPKVLEYYEKYFDVKYPLPKQDMIAIPDFNAGAMENWGLITFREVALLYDPEVSTASSQPFVASVIAHELAHQWFGNLVTMKWWTDLWLNEGFATYVAALGVHNLHPEWNSLDEEVVDNMMSVFSLDALKSSHPISVPIGHPREIAQIFDTISYKKGSFVLRMMNLFLGESTFRNGVSKYLNKHAYRNAEQNDLWHALTEVAHEKNSLPKGVTVKMIMDSWTLQTGYPVVTVKRNYKLGTAIITQKRYVADRESESDNTTWWIPISYTTEFDHNFNVTEPKTWMTNEDKSITIENLPDKGWVIFNVKIAGVYKVRYDEQNWQYIIDHLYTNEYKKIDLLNRVQLIDDSLDLARTGDIDYSIPFKILKYLRKEVEYLPWKSALRNLGHLDKMFRLTVGYGQFREFVRNLIMPIYDRISELKYEESPTNLHKLKLQTLISAWACKYEACNCREKAITTFSKWMETDDLDKENPIPKDSRSYIYCTAIKHGGEKEWNFLWRKYLSSNVGNERSMILSVLSCTREVWLLKRYLEWSIDENSGIRRQDSSAVFAAIGRGDVGYILAKDFFNKRIKDIYKYFGPKATRMAVYINVLASQITTDDELKEFSDFTHQHKSLLEQSQQAVQQSLENAKINMQWRKHFFKRTTNLLSTNFMLETAAKND